MNTHGRIAILAGGWLALACPCPAQVSLSGGNLGYTSFMDGFGMPGFYSDQYLYFTHADSFRDAGGDKLPGHNQMHNLMIMPNFKYIFAEPTVFGAWPGVDISVPILLDLKVDTERVSENETNIGDVFLGFMLQFPEKKVWGRFPFYQRMEILTKFPTGHYGSNDYVNAGNNAYAINPYYACTMFLNRNVEVSVRLFYKWTSTNDDPPPIPSPEWDREKDPQNPIFADDIQEGEAVWANYAVSYGVTDRLRLGVNGYGLQMISNHKIDGHEIPDSKEKVFAIGPGAMYISRDRKDIWYLNGYHEAYVENRAKNDLVFVWRWVHAF